MSKSMSGARYAGHGCASPVQTRRLTVPHETGSIPTTDSRDARQLASTMTASAMFDPQGVDLYRTRLMAVAVYHGGCGCGCGLGGRDLGARGYC